MPRHSLTFLIYTTTRRTSSPCSAQKKKTEKDLVSFRGVAFSRNAGQVAIVDSHGADIFEGDSRLVPLNGSHSGEMSASLVAVSGDGMLVAVAGYESAASLRTGEPSQAAVKVFYTSDPRVAMRVF